MHHSNIEYVLKAPLGKGYFAGFKDEAQVVLTSDIDEAVIYISYGNAETVRRIWGKLLRAFEIVERPTR